MSAAGETTKAGVLPATQHNVLTGAGWAALIFPQLVGLGYGVFFGALDGEFVGFGGFPGMATAYLMTAVVSAVPGLLAIIAIGIPLSLLASRMVRSSSSIAVNTAAQFFAGFIGAIVPAILLLRFLTGMTIDEFVVLFALPPIIAAGISAALGWRIALTSARRAARKPPTIDEDAVAEDAFAGSS